MTYKYHIEDTGKVRLSDPVYADDTGTVRQITDVHLTVDATPPSGGARILACSALFMAEALVEGLRKLNDAERSHIDVALVHFFTQVRVMRSFLFRIGRNAACGNLCHASVLEHVQLSHCEFAELSTTMAPWHHHGCGKRSTIGAAVFSGNVVP